ncbi:hypothetical protein QCA50_009395 [Cerrena zonata]|uniref:Uncharacterized protein n=1 Tax=Cerrena zonata TaxID=2478898 RepID=A0AAW0G186_9APHY
MKFPIKCSQPLKFSRLTGTPEPTPFAAALASSRQCPDTHPGLVIPSGCQSSSYSCSSSWAARPVTVLKAFDVKVAKPPGNLYTKENKGIWFLVSILCSIFSNPITLIYSIALDFPLTFA